MQIVSLGSNLHEVSVYILGNVIQEIRLRYFMQIVTSIVSDQSLLSGESIKKKKQKKKKKTKKKKKKKKQKKKKKKKNT